MSNVNQIMAQVKQDEPLFPDNTFYDINKKEYLFPLTNGGWLPLAEGQFRRQLRGRGYRQGKDREELVSPLDAALNAVQLEAAVDYAGPLAGYRAGKYDILGRSVLVTNSPTIITPAPGSWNTMKALLQSLFGDASHPQIETFMAWLKIYVACLHTEQRRTGQALVLAGPKDCGKSLLQNLLTIIMGDREARPYQFALGGTAFNADLLQAEHQKIEDESPSTDIRTRRIFGAYLKGVAANQSQRLHQKGKDALVLEPLWRVTVSVNDDPEHLLVLPPLDESLMDKIIILKCSPPAHPFNDGSSAGREAYWNALVQELPAFIHYLQSWPIPEELTCSRYGVKAFIHPEIADAIMDLSDELRLLNLIDMAQPWNTSGSWEGTSEELEHLLRDNDAIRFEASRLLSWNRACGTYLARLARSHRARVQEMGRIDNRRLWRLCQPANVFPTCTTFHENL